MREVDISPRCQDEKPGLWLTPEPGAKPGEARGEVGVDVLWRPVMSGRGAQRPRAEQDGVGACAQQSHQESVGLVAAADHRAGRRMRPQRYDAVERRDEVRVDGALREAEATVDALEVGRQVVTRQVRLEEDLERIDQ